MKESDSESRILIPLPPFPGFVKEVKTRISEIFIETPPEYIETLWFEGPAFSWKTWYALDNYSSSYKDQVRKFKEWIKNKIQDETKEEILAIEFQDPNNWEWLDVKDRGIYNEVFSNRYILDHQNCIDIYQDFLRVKTERGVCDVQYNDLRYDYLTHLKPILQQKLKRRGLI